MNEPTIAAIADMICEYFTGGIRLGDDILSFAYSTLGASTPAELEPLLLDPAEYGEGMLDLVFSPSENITFDIEPLVPPEGIPSQAQEDIVALVSGRVHLVRIYLEFPSLFANRSLTRSLVSGFVKKLKLGKEIRYLPVPGDAGMATRHVIVAARVMARAMEFTATAKRETFIERLAGQLVLPGGLEERLVLKCLGLILRLFRDIPDDLDIADLMLQKIQLNRAIMERKKFFDEYQRTHTMEFLMCQKIYDPPESIDAMAEEIALIEIIKAAVYGWRSSEYADDRSDMGALVREWERLQLHEA